jgi:CRISPR/Cas system-associated exonuclease Cas4 (RecB family)
MRIIRVSEINSFLFCQRAWWYRLQGEIPENQEELAEGVRLHERHGQVMMIAGALKYFAYICFFAALIVISIYFTIHVLLG